MLRPHPLVFLFAYYKGHGAMAKSTPVGVGCYNIFFSQLYHNFCSSPRNGKLRNGHGESCGLSEWQSCEKVLGHLSI